MTGDVEAHPPPKPTRRSSARDVACADGRADGTCANSRNRDRDKASLSVTRARRECRGRAALGVDAPVTAPFRTPGGSAGAQQQEATGESDLRPMCWCHVTSPPSLVHRRTCEDHGGPVIDGARQPAFPRSEVRTVARLRAREWSGVGHMEEYSGCRRGHRRPVGSAERWPSSPEPVPGSVRSWPSSLWHRRPRHAGGQA